ncbi:MULTISPECIES: hypothetical protein [Planktothricoides]|uniref:Uncharacterized protein n=1 Tax=Planktothricoides raciborskii GIHE-MW2 TaxID=2792601 RepID=A0AAU8J9K7_9CYAN|nr:hypothetical protein [Planktothricoides sp. SR001]
MPKRMTRVAGVGAKERHVQSGAECRESGTFRSVREVGEAIPLSTLPTTGL